MAPVTRKRARAEELDRRATKKTRYCGNNSVNASSSKRKAKSRSRSKPFAQDDSTVDAGFIHTHTKSTPVYIEISSDDDEPPCKETPISLTQGTTGLMTTTSIAPCSGVVSSGATAPIEAYDVCFGLVRYFLHSLLSKHEIDEIQLIVEATCTADAKLPHECSPVTLTFEGRVLRVFLEGSTERVAIVVSNTLARLVGDFAVTLTATICGRKQKSSAGKEPKKKDADPTASVKFCSLRVILYGFLALKDRVADILAEGDLFLQHPGATEFDRTVKYANPQYLLPPGEEMPEVEKLSGYACCAGRVARSEATGSGLGEQEQSQIFNIFNTAYDANGVLANIEPSPRLATELKRHQVEALAMMVEKEVGVYDNASFPAMWRSFRGPNGTLRYQHIVTETFLMERPPPICGGILADEMGLGKTLSLLSLVCHSLDSRDDNPNLSESLPKATLVVTPKSTIYGWEKQIKTHILADKIRWVTYHGSKRHEIWKDIELYDVVLTTYDTLRSDRGKETLLFEHRWARIVLDEAHKIRNRSSRIFRDACAIKADFRWCLTGTPIHNNIDDFGALLAFVKVSPLETSSSFHSYIIEPLKKHRGKGLAILRRVVAATCLRRTKADHATVLKLPRKAERVERVELDRKDRRLYEFFKRFSYLTAGLDKTSKKKAATNILVLISMLRLICDHGEALIPKSALTAWKKRDKNALTWEMLESTIKKCVSCNCQIEELGTAEPVTEGLRCGHVLCGSCVAKSQTSASQLPCPKCKTAALQSPSAKVNTNLTISQSAEASPLRPRFPPSAKVVALIRNISEKKRRPRRKSGPTKSVIFSYWTKMLDLIAAALKEKGLKFRRIDGQSSMSQRKEAMETFGSDPECNIMLASIGAAGEGIDLTAAKSVHIMEPHWNPMAEAQAVDRVHRIGQQQDVEVVRYIVDDSIESYIQWVQRDKLRLITDSLSTSELKVENINEERWKKLLNYLE